MLNAQIPRDVLETLYGLRQRGYQAYVVGGCVRDLLAAKVPHDWDICTDALPSQVHACFAERASASYGEKHGTVLVHTGERTVEITTFRQDGTYTDHRRPDGVHYVTNLMTDLRRRDFTVNAMAYTPEDGLIDPFSGEEDLQNHILRAVGDPVSRFSEDALRILRGVRLAALENLQIEPVTGEGMCQCAPLLTSISVERVFAEIQRFLLAPADRISELLRAYVPIWQTIFYELGTDAETWCRIADVVVHTPVDAVVRWAALFSNQPEPEQLAQCVLNRLHCPQDLCHQICAVLQWLHEDIPTDVPHMHYCIGIHGVQSTWQWLQLRRAMAYTDMHEIQQLARGEMAYHAVFSAHNCLSRSELQISGQDLLDLGCTQGPELGAMLQKIYEEVLWEHLPNDHAALLSYAQTQIPFS